MFGHRKNRNSSSLAAFVCCIVLLTAAPAIASEAGRSGSESFRAYAISLGGLQAGGSSAPSGATAVDFVIDRFSTASERSRLLEALKSGGRDKLHRTLEKMDPVGRIQVSGRLGYDLRYAREIMTDDGDRLLILATNRPLSLVELKRQTQSRKYDISVVELFLDAIGHSPGPDSRPESVS